MRYWGNLPEQIVSSILGMGSDYTIDLPEDFPIPVDKQDAFLDILRDHASWAEHAAEQVLDAVYVAGKRALAEFLRTHGENPADWRHKIWLKNIPDELADEAAFAMMGGDPEYNGLTLDYIPEMLRDLGIERAGMEDEVFHMLVEDTRDAGSEYEQYLEEKIQELWDEAKAEVMALGDEDEYDDEEEEEEKRYEAVDPRQMNLPLEARVRRQY